MRLGTGGDHDDGVGDGAGRTRGDGGRRRPNLAERVLLGAADGFALAGGAVLLAVMATTVTSVIGRTLFNRPVLGDFELVEIGSAVVIFAFLPYCQLRGGNVIVDVFTRGAGARTRARLDSVHSLVYALIAALLAGRLAVGGVELRAWGETSMILAVPIWWGFVPIVASVALLTIICIYTLFRGHEEPGR